MPTPPRLTELGLCAVGSDVVEYGGLPGMFTAWVCQAAVAVEVSYGVWSRSIGPEGVRRSRPTKRPINQHPPSASPLNNANLMAGLHAGDRVDTKPTEQGGGIESL